MRRLKTKPSATPGYFRKAVTHPYLRIVKKLGQATLHSDWENMLILGENLSTLQHLAQDPRIVGQVRLIYIDPPFATNQIFRGGDWRVATVSASFSDRIAYEDKLLGSGYLDFLRARFHLLKDLLADDGSIYVHIDTKMGHYVKVLMDEIFGREHFVNDITRIKCNPKNFERGGYGNIKDMVLFYTKTDSYAWNEPRIAIAEEEVARLFPKMDKDGRRYTTTPIHAPGETRNGRTGKRWEGLTPPTGRHWRCDPRELTRLDRAGLIEWSSTRNPRKKIYAEDVLLRGKKLQDIWDFKDPQYPTYPTEKNVEMLKLIIQTSSNPDDLVLDCFAGSGMTLVAAGELGRRWIGIDNSRLAIKTAQKRLLDLGSATAFSLYECIPAKDKKVSTAK